MADLSARRLFLHLRRSGYLLPAADFWKIPRHGGKKPAAGRQTACQQTEEQTEKVRWQQTATAEKVITLLHRQRCIGIPDIPQTQ